MDVTFYREKRSGRRKLVEGFNGELYYIFLGVHYSFKFQNTSRLINADSEPRHIGDGVYISKDYDKYWIRYDIDDYASETVKKSFIFEFLKWISLPGLFLSIALLAFSARGNGYDAGFNLLSPIATFCFIRSVRMLAKRKLHSFFWPIITGIILSPLFGLISVIVAQNYAVNLNYSSELIMCLLSNIVWGIIVGIGLTIYGYINGY